jgi:hypothetical protein
MNEVLFGAKPDAKQILAADTRVDIMLGAHNHMHHAYTHLLYVSAMYTKQRRARILYLAVRAKGLVL